MADVEVVATYELYNINRTKLENIIHRFFEPARLDIQIRDRFGQPVVPRVWFLVPLYAVDEVDEMVTKIKEGTIGDYVNDVEMAVLVPPLHSSQAGITNLSGRTDPSNRHFGGICSRVLVGRRPPQKQQDGCC